MNENKRKTVLLHLFFYRAQHCVTKRDVRMTQW